MRSLSLSLRILKTRFSKDIEFEKNFEFFDGFKTFQDKNLRREELKDI